MGIPKGRLSAVLRSLFHLAGKGDRKVIAVFGVSPDASQAAVHHVRQGAGGISIWLFSPSPPSTETAQFCERIFVCPSSALLLWQAERLLWRRWVALCAGTWTGGHGAWLIKIAPFLIPPFFRVVLLNRHGDFLSASPSAIVQHNCRCLWDALASIRNLCHGYWLLLSVHLWRSGPFTRLKDYTSGYWLLLTVHLWRSGPFNRLKDYTRLLTYHLWRSGPSTRIKHVVLASALLGAATVLRWCGYPDRRLFHRLQKGGRLRMETGRGTGSGVLVYHSAGSVWNTANLEVLARSSDARWILWSESGANEPMEGMLPLFEDERTFAVCRQSHFRGWNPVLIATAPFRKLQAGEASPVMAPVSPLMLVDRRKLLALGIPRCSMVRTAWMLLFWKAAAAGWRSYCIGGNALTAQEPDYPLHERAFIFHVLADARLRLLGPREPDLMRGNVAFPSTRFTVQTEPSRKLKVLIVSPFLLYPMAHGGAVRIFNLCRVLRQRVDFSLVALHERRERIHYAKLHEVFDQVRIVDNDEPATRDECLPAQVREHQCRGLRAAIAQLAEEWQPDFLQIEYTHLAGLRDSAPHVPAILVEHDLTFTLYRQLADRQPDPEAQREYKRWLDFEHYWLHRYDAVWTVSEDDRQTAISEGSRPHQTFAVPNGVDIDHFTSANSAASSEILYVGSFRHLPNILGFEHLTREIMPRIWRSFPQARLHVVAGPRHAKYWRNLSRESVPLPADNRIVVEGFVKDLRPLYAQASIVVVPLEISAGTNIKVLEAMACGKAIVTTPAGCAGLNLRSGQDALVGGDWEEFARCVCELLANPKLRARLGAQARRTAEQRFSWQASADCAYRSYAALVAMQDRSQNRVRA